TAQDQGNYAAASQAFSAAASRDPGFTAAGAAATASVQADAASGASAGDVAGGLGGPTAPPIHQTLTNQINTTVGRGAGPLGTGGGSQGDNGGGGTPPPKPPLGPCGSLVCGGPQVGTLIGNIIIIITRP